MHPCKTGARETPLDAKFDQGFNIFSSDGETTRRLAAAVPLDCHCNSGVNRQYRWGVNGKRPPTVVTDAIIAKVMERVDHDLHAIAFLKLGV